MNVSFAVYGEKFPYYENFRWILGKNLFTFPRLLHLEDVLAKLLSDYFLKIKS